MCAFFLCLVFLAVILSKWVIALVACAPWQLCSLLLTGGILFVLSLLFFFHLSLYCLYCIVLQSGLPVYWNFPLFVVSWYLTSHFFDNFLLWFACCSQVSWFSWLCIPSWSPLSCSFCYCSHESHSQLLFHVSRILHLHTALIQLYHRQKRNIYANICIYICIRLYVYKGLMVIFIIII